MKITYIVGNGFDLGLGLRTSYNDFLKDFLHPKTAASYDVEFARKCLCGTIAKNKRTWANAEVAFADLKFASMFDKTSGRQAQIIRLTNGFKQALLDYLTKEQGKFFPGYDVDLAAVSARFKERMVKSLYEGYKGLGLRGAAELKLVDAGQQNYVNLINLNYTYTADYLFWGSSGGRTIPFVCNLGSGQRLNLNVGNVHHVHGSITNKDILFGVSDSSQVTDKLAKEIAQYSGVLIKSKLDKEENGDHYSPALNDLRTSSAIVTFGVSFGRSDKLWWNELARLVIENDVRVFVFPFATDGAEKMNSVERALIRTEWRNKLFSSIRAEMDKTTFNRLQDNMHKVIVLPFGPYGKHDGSTGYNDPWDLEYFKSQVIR